MLHKKELFHVSFMALVLAGCTSGAELTTPQISLSQDKLIVEAKDEAPVVQVQEPTVIATSGKEFFSEGQYGVKASPRVAQVSPLAMNADFNENGSALVSYAGKVGLAPPKTKLKRGGGRAQIGKPYTIRGQRFVPRKQPNYNRTGNASWYGSAFHGRLTANGEVYDMNHLSAAHPTLPLPSYVRVTNVANGRSVIVRVNDRGPFAKNRIIDLSRRAAIALGTTKAGVAKVNVKYVGPAPVNGEDDAYLLASFRAPNTPQGDQVIASLPQSGERTPSAVPPRYPSKPLSYVQSEIAEINAPYQSDRSQIFVPISDIRSGDMASLKAIEGVSITDNNSEGVFLSIDSLANANNALRQLWRHGFDNAMFYQQ